MSIRIGVSLAVVLAAAVGAADIARAEMAAPPKPKPVTTTGCAQKAVPEFCVRLNSYNVTGADPAVPIGKRVKLSGTVKEGGLSPCPGTILENIKWKPVRGGCPKAK